MKKLLLISTLIWVASTSFAQCIKGDCVSGTGEKKYPDGSKFVGTFKSGQKLKGVYSYPNGDQYEGSFKGGGLLLKMLLKLLFNLFACLRSRAFAFFFSFPSAGILASGWRALLGENVFIFFIFFFMNIIITSEHP